MIYSNKQRAITFIQINRLEADVSLLTKIDKRSPIEKAQIGALISITEELRWEIEDFDLRLMKKVYHT